ncbi:M48 family metallopeptidase [Arenibacterium halophilum]|uniref:M48 family metallopeptidase n=1 Tax=Arenibacterium halophilum TaxID=2583821 RepID=A0ABY2XDD0_9RHOB|nr:M48 family metallopeptidase [Arenibacterium halophilum]TMV14701.1 M48 family metallopeptidase [Arenibacterium halophilum]
MLRFSPILLAVLYAVIMYRFSVWRTNRELNSKSTRLVDPRLNRLTDRMAASLEVDQVPVHIYEIDPVNGLAAPDGRIFITRGFYRKFQAGEITAEEMGSVIAHELGHVALGHSRRRMIDFSGQNAIRTALMMVIGRFVPFIGPWIAGMLTSLLAARLSRQDEYEADEYAAALLTKAGIGIAPQKSMFRKLAAMSEGHGSAPAWLLSHPKTEERIAALERLERNWGLYPPS